MNIFDGSGKGAARIRYLDANFEVVTPGSYVVCAVTGKHIPLEELRYWSVARQEAYVDAHASFEAEKRVGALPTDKS
ncbi:DUF2093 domain-containing protein [Martelella mediterranea]|uniref:DUF2093 domain-containing protein n=1 Tax=Martelella mediterranea TaxID=293089 RepID=UPI001E59B2F2|nr:DUF2093 domain-containing protein [Martelella mediterranea]MCD1634174.1 DUF2093 domain-containing protein [Martelella mediterranea]